jgi:hypothetical protein
MVGRVNVQLHIQVTNILDEWQNCKPLCVAGRRWLQAAAV